MKTTYFLRVLACAGVLAVAAARISSADTVVTTHHDAWATDHDGYWDDHNAHHAYIMHEHHHGYWRENNGSRVFINID